MSQSTRVGVLRVYIPFYIAPTTILGGKRSVLFHFLKHPSLKSAYVLINAVREGSRYLDTRRIDLDPWEYLARCLCSLAGIESHRVKVYVYTNARREVFSNFISNYPQGNKFEIIHHEVDLNELDHPYLLTWSPRDRMKSDIANGGQQDLYLYLEHDIDFRSENLTYFIQYRAKLQDGVTPGFMLVEWNSKGKFWSNFQIEKHDFSSGIYIKQDDSRFIPLIQPYCPVLLLDKKLADEFIVSEFFKIEDFTDMQSKYGLLVRESAAIGMTYFGKERNYAVRSYVGFHEDSKLPLVGAIVRHMPNIYSEYESIPQCKNPLNQMW